MDELAVALRAAHPQALATLTRLLGDVDLAEESLQEASVRAIGSWRDRGVPDLPAAWLVRTARNYIVDLHRGRALQERHRGKVAEVIGGDEAAWSQIETDACEPVKDDLLRLVFTCCHPQLPEDARVILTLKTLAGLTVEEIASAFLVSERAMEQRLTRAKRRIRDSGIPYATPDADELQERLESVLAVVYLIFNEGYKAARGPEAMREPLAREAIRIGRVLCSLFRDHAEVTGLLALMLLQHSRSGARLDEDGELIPLDQQDRTRWDATMIAQGRALLERALRAGRPGAFQIQAAIAAIHAVARSDGETDWVEIASLYRMLERHQPSPVVTLNRAVAVSRVEGSAAALAVLAGIESDPALQRYHHFHAVKAELHADLGDTVQARSAYERALDLASNPRERSFLERRLAHIDP